MVPDGCGDRPTDQIHPSQQLHPFPCPSLLRARQKRLEDPARVGQTDNRYVARVGDVVLEEYAHHAQSDVVDGLAVDGRIAPGTRYAGGQKEEPRDIVLDDAALYQPRERGVVDVVGAPGRALDPVPGVVRPGCPRDVGQRGIEEPVFERRRIDEDELFEVRIYAFLQGQIHQYRAGEHGVERVSRETEPGWSRRAARQAATG